MQQQLVPMKAELSEMADVVSYIKHSLMRVKSKSEQNAGTLEKLQELCDEHFNEQQRSPEQAGTLRVDPFNPLHHLLFRRVNDLEKLHPLVLSLQDQVKSLQQQMKHRDEQSAQNEEGMASRQKDFLKRHMDKLSGRSQDLQEIKASFSAELQLSLDAVNDSLGNTNKKVKGNHNITMMELRRMADMVSSCIERQNGYDPLEPSQLFKEAHIPHR